MKIKVCEHCNKPDKLEATYSIVKMELLFH